MNHYCHRKILHQLIEFCYNVINSSILQETFSSLSECSSCNTEETELRLDNHKEKCPVACMIPM